MTLELTEKQKEARKLAQSKVRFVLFRGGSRSGKSFLICYLILIRALITPKSRHGIFRKTAVDVRRTLFDLTFKAVMDAAYPGLWEQLKLDKKINDTEMTIEFPNGSIIMFDGLDDSTRQDRILGNEYSTVFVNEITQFREFDIFQKLLGRLSLELPMDNGKLLSPKLFLDCNPTTKRHWSYRAFIEKVNPIDSKEWPRPDEWAQIQMNPVDNTANISSTYLDDLENLSARDRKRFLEGEWQADNDNALFQAEWWYSNRLPAWQPSDAAKLKRIVVAVDPSGSSKPGSDETGIMVVGQDDAGHLYVLEDCSGVMAPSVWGKRACDALDYWGADYIVAEADYGSEMVANTIRTATSRVVMVKPVKTKGRSKETRAYPVAALYEQGMVSHCGAFDKLEGQLEDFHVDWNRNKDGSPDRLDALVWGLTEIGVKEVERRGGRSQRVANFWS